MNRFALGAVMLLIGAACTERTSLNRNCKFGINKEDGGFITEQKARELSLNNKDFVGLGSTDCDSQICVRDGKYVARPDIKDTDRAEGYCTDQCSVGQKCESEDPQLDKAEATRLTCRNLLLSEEVLADPAISTLLGGLKTSFFCARGGGSPDSGM